MSARRVHLHVGTPKSGTSYLQDTLALNREGLERQGVEYVATRTGDHFEAALDLIGERWAGEEENAAGQWDALVEHARLAPRHVLVSHEILAAAGPEQARRALGSFPDHEPHVVVTARDLGRQVPAEWQERIKHRGGRDYAGFLTALQRNYTRSDWSMWFWRVQHLPRILRTWGESLPPEQVHLVTVPQQGAPRGLLWERYAHVLGLDPLAPYAESPTTNASIGGAEVTLLRRLNIALKARGVPRATYVDWVRQTVVKEVLAERAGKVPATVPPRHRADVEAITHAWLEEVRASGVHVVGDLDDLLPVWPPEDEWADPDRPDPEVVAEAAIEALAHVLARVGTPAEEESRRARIPRLTRLLRG